MAYTIKIGQFAKNIESTARPDTTGWTAYDVTFKNGADISNPDITLNVDWATIKDANYAVMLNRYYWITAKNMLRENYCALQLKVDVLATYKTEIGNSSLYVLRAASDSDGTIMDHYYPTTTAISYTEETDDFYYNADPYNNGFFVVNVSGISSAGTSTLWKLSPANFRNFIANLYTNIDGFQFSDIWAALQKLAGGSPTKLVSSAMWFPNGITFTTGTSYSAICPTAPEK